MKGRYILLLLLVVLGISCGKDDGGVPNLPFLNARAGGVVKDCNNVTVTLTASVLQINAQTTAGDAAFILNLNNYTQGQIGTFEIGPGNFTTALYREGTTSYTAGTGAGSGRIQVTNSSSTGIQGNFEFTGVSTTGATKVITEGRFSAYY
ncbi:MAG TPA: DUF6252 family protein [Chitinophagaceae bacterium]|nr:DUF6252 family protein [Chitinophagaceae bacterium]